MSCPNFNSSALKISASTINAVTYAEVYGELHISRENVLIWAYGTSPTWVWGCIPYSVQASCLDHLYRKPRGLFLFLSRITLASFSSTSIEPMGNHVETYASIVSSIGKQTSFRVFLLAMQRSLLPWLLTMFFSRNYFVSLILPQLFAHVLNNLVQILSTLKIARTQNVAQSAS